MVQYKINYLSLLKSNGNNFRIQKDARFSEYEIKMRYFLHPINCINFFIKSTGHFRATCCFAKFKIKFPCTLT